MIKKNKKKATISLTPLIDIVFILLIFFMTTMTLTRIKTIDLELPKTVAKSNGGLKKELVVFTVTNKGAVFKRETFADVESLVDYIKDSNKKATWGIKPDDVVSTDLFLKTWKILKDNNIAINIISPYKKGIKK